MCTRGCARACSRSCCATGWPCARPSARASRRARPRRPCCWTSSRRPSRWCATRCTGSRAWPTGCSPASPWRP
ncbi:hypothetical protein EG872_15925, partial [Enterococcus faecalis]